MLGVMFGCVGIVCVCKIILSFEYGVIMQLLGVVLASGVVYGLILILFRNDIACTVLRKACRIYEK